MGESMGPLETIKAKTRGRMNRINVQGDNRAGVLLGCHITY